MGFNDGGVAWGVYNGGSSPWVGVTIHSLLFLHPQIPVFRPVRYLANMAIMDRFRGSFPRPASSTTDPEKEPQYLQISARDRFRPRIILMAVLVSMGGFIFGYDTGQISGFLEMPDFLDRFADKTDSETGERVFSHGRSGTIVGLVGWMLSAHLERITANNCSCL